MWRQICCLLNICGVVIFHTFDALDVHIGFSTLQNLIILLLLIITVVVAYHLKSAVSYDTLWLNNRMCMTLNVEHIIAYNNVFVHTLIN